MGVGSSAIDPILVSIPFTKEGQRVRTDFGIVLYVVAKDAVGAQVSRKRGPRGGRGLTKKEIEEEVARHLKRLPANFRVDVVDPACEYFRRQDYFELDQGKGYKRYILNAEATLKTLILDKLDAQIVYAIYDEMAITKDERFSVQDAIAACVKKIAEVSEEELRKRFIRLSETPGAGYFEETLTSGFYKLVPSTIDEERPYLDCVIKYGFRSPQGTSTANGKTKRSPRRPKKTKARRR